MKNLFILAFVTASLIATAAQAAVVVIGNNNIGAAEAKEVKKVFLGKKSDIGGVSVTPVMSADAALTNAFIDKVIEQSPDAFNAYWTEKTFTGQGNKPRELSNDAAVKAFVGTTAGAIGYIDDKNLDATVKVLLKP
jgi:hypothetical protein